MCIRDSSLAIAEKSLILFPPLLTPKQENTPQENEKKPDINLKTTETEQGAMQEKVSLKYAQPTHSQYKLPPISPPSDKLSLGQYFLSATPDNDIRTEVESIN